MPDSITELIARMEKGEIELFELLGAISRRYSDIGHTADGSRIDHDRLDRCGFPEFIYGAGKSVAQLLAIIPEAVVNGPVLVTRIDEIKAHALLAEYPQAIYDKEGCVLLLRAAERPWKDGLCAILCAGTSDIGVAKEALFTLNAADFRGELYSDVGVAGLQRLLAVVDELRKFDVLIVIAGMEGALPSVVAGLVRLPVIAVPTSVGYGAAAGGFSALGGMLNSCGSGVTVVNIDNGFGAACGAIRILNRFSERL